MKVRIIANRGSSLPVEMMDDSWNLTPEREFNLTVGAEHTVYAVTALKGVFWYHILDNSETGCPIWYPCPLFEVTDGSIPPWWVAHYSPHVSGNRYLGTSIISFKEWATDISFYERLYDGEPVAVSIFERERARIEQ